MERRGKEASKRNRKRRNRWKVRDDTGIYRYRNHTSSLNSFRCVIYCACGDFDGKNRDQKVARKAIRTINALIFFFKIFF